MQIKKFEAKNLQEALQVIKKELGPEAVILSTRKNRKTFGLLNSSSVEVTAAISNHALLKKRIAENKMRGELKEKTQNLPAAKQASVYDRFARKIKEEAAEKLVTRTDHTRAAQGKMHADRLSKKYVDIAEGDSDREMYEAKRPAPAQRAPVPVAQPAVVAPKVPTPQQQFAPPQNMPDAQTTEFGLLYEHLVWVGVQPDIAGQIVGAIRSDHEHWKAIRRENIQVQMQELIPIVLNYIRIGKPVTELQSRNKRVFSFVGPTGAGKTTTIAKLATRLKLQGRTRMAFVTCDTQRVGGTEQLQKYAQILESPFYSVDSVELLRSIIGQLMSEVDIVFVDTPGTSSLDREKLAQIQKMFSVIPNNHIFLTTPVSQRSSSHGNLEAASRYGGLRYDGLIFTKADETDTRGEIINMAYASKQPVYYISQGQRIPDDLEVASRELIGKIVFHQFSWEI